MDAGLLWRQRRWLALYDYIDQLPSNSRFTEAFYNDEEMLALAYPKGPPTKVKNKKPDPPSLRDWSPEFQALTEIKDALVMQIHQTSAINGGRPKKPDPSPRPVTGLDKVKAKPTKSQQILMDRFAERFNTP